MIAWTEQNVKLQKRRFFINKINETNNKQYAANKNCE